MSKILFTSHDRIIGITAAWSLFLLGVVYGITTILGFLSLKSPLDPIADPFFSIMEILTIIIATSMVILMVSIHNFAQIEFRAYSLTALIFIIILATITSGVHFVVLMMAHHFEKTELKWVSLFFSFKWPSLVYSLDILAWDWFFALAMFFAAPVFKVGRLEKTVKVLMIISGILSLLGLIGVPLANMQIRNIGIIGYAVFAPVIFLLIGIIFWCIKPKLSEVENTQIMNKSGA